MTDNPQYGRKWSLVLKNSRWGTIEIKQDDMTTPSLKLSFRVDFSAYQAIYIGDINIWNLKPDIVMQIITGDIEGTEVILSAGYMYGKFGQIFKGTVFQGLYQREGVTDWRLHLHCVDGYQIFTGNFTKFSLPEGYRMLQLVNAVAAHSQKTIPIGTVSKNIKDTVFPRGVVGFTESVNMYREIVRTSNAQMYIKDGHLEIKKLDDAMDPNPIVISPTTGLIGTPQQIDKGVMLRCLLNPEIKLSNPMKAIQLMDSQINLSVVTPGSTPRNYAGILPTGFEESSADGNPFKAGYFQIGGVSHVGDTRGNDWYSDVIGYTSGGKADFRLAMKDTSRPPGMQPTSETNKN